MTTNAPGVERAWPASQELERAAIAGALVNASAAATVFSALDAAAFHDPRTRTAFIAARAIHDRGESVNLLTVLDELERRDQLDEVGGAVGLATMSDVSQSPASCNVGGVVERLRDYARRRRAIYLAEHLAAAAWNTSQRLDDAVGAAEQFVSTALSTRARPAVETKCFTFCSAAALLAVGAEDVPWRWRGYLADGALTVLAGREKSGKSTLIFGLMRALIRGTPLPLRPSCAVAPVR